MDLNPLVSVLMNCYNGARYVREAIDSVRAQSYTNWEIVFWDNRSSDGSAEIVRSYRDDRIRYFLAPKFSGLGAARRQAMIETRGKWVGILDCDDQWVPEKLERQVAVIRVARREGVRLGLVYGKSLWFDGERPDWDVVAHYPQLPEGRVLCNLVRENFVSNPTALFLRSAYFEVGGFSERMRMAADYQLWCAIAETYEFRTLDGFLARYRWHGANDSLRLWKQAYHESMQIVRRYLGTCPGARERLRELKRKYRAEKIQRLRSSLGRFGSRARSIAKSLIRFRPGLPSIS